MRLALFLELLSNNTHAIYRARQLKSSYPFLIDLNRKIELQSRDQQRRRAAPTSSEPAVGGLMTDSATRIPSRPSSRGQRTDSERSEEHTSELQSLMRISYAVFCLKKKNNTYNKPPNNK